MKKWKVQSTSSELGPMEIEAEKMVRETPGSVTFYTDSSMVAYFPNIVYVIEIAQEPVAA